VQSSIFSLRQDRFEDVTTPLLHASALQFRWTGSGALEGLSSSCPAGDFEGAVLRAFDAGALLCCRHDHLFRVFLAS
jgi:hypothetical protein